MAEIALQRRVTAVENFARRPDRGDASGIDESHQVRQVRGIEGRMDRHQDREAGLPSQSVDQPDHVDPQARVEPGKGLIEKHQRPPTNQGASQRDTLALTARQFAWAPRSQTGEVDARERIVDLGP